MYLEDTGITAIRDVQCALCGYEEEAEGTHYLDSETFRWECRCGNLNEEPAPYDPIDPDQVHEERMLERYFD